MRGGSRMLVINLNQILPDLHWQTRTQQGHNQVNQTNHPCWRNHPVKRKLPVLLRKHQKVASIPQHANTRMIFRNQSKYRWKQFVNTICLDLAVTARNAKNSTQLSNKFLNSWLLMAFRVLTIKIMEPRRWKSMKKMKSRSKKASLSLVFKVNRTFPLLKKFLRNPRPNLRQLYCLLKKFQSRMKIQVWSLQRESLRMRSYNQSSPLFSSTIALSKTLFKKTSNGTSIKFQSFFSRRSR